MPVISPATKMPGLLVSMFGVHCTNHARANGS